MTLRCNLISLETADLRKLIKSFTLFILALFSFLFFSLHKAAADDPASVLNYMSGAYPRPLSKSVVLIDAASGKVLYGVDPYKHLPPASLTKMMAAIVLLENGKLTDTVTAPDAVKGIPESSLHLVPGEQISLEDLLYAMMLRSANDTPVAGAYYLSGGIPPFVDLMNQKAAAIGCRNTHFVTPNGLEADGHYSCAYDLSQIARYGMNNLPMFRKIVKTQEYVVNRSILKSDELVTNTSESFLKYFPGADGVKTGYISQAGHCFVGAATRNGFTLIAVAMHSVKCRSDVVEMLSYGFKNFQPIKVYPKGWPAGNLDLGNGQVVPIVTGADLDDAVVKSQVNGRIGHYTFRTAPLANLPAGSLQFGSVVGTVTLYYGSKAISTVDAIAAGNAAALPSHILSHGFSLPKGDKVLRNILVTIAVIVLLPIIYVAVRLVDMFLYARKIAENSRRRRAGVEKEVGAVDR